LDGALAARAAFYAKMEQLKQYNKPLDEYIAINNSPAWPDEGIQQPTVLGEANYGHKRKHIRNEDGEGKETERWITPTQVTGLADYVYLQAYCHLREDERSFRLDRIVDVRVKV
jgi:predicted DNA-binding transcriptional regulator YafY